MKGIRNFFNEFVKDCSFKTYYISDPFHNAYDASANKLMDGELFSAIDDMNVCFLYSNHITIVIKLTNNKKDKFVNMRGIVFDNNAIIGIIDHFKIFYAEPNPIPYDSRAWSSATLPGADKWFMNYPLLVLFIKYADVITKIISPGQKIKDVNCNYKNETNTTVTELNSLWFTNLHVSGAFKIRGHFRLQPKKKNGEWTKELIWIKDYDKEGYTAPARKLKEGESPPNESSAQVSDTTMSHT